MSATWIKLYDDTHEDPRVFRMGQLLAKTADRYITRHEARDLLGDVTSAVTRDALRDITIAGLARVWRAANRHTTDGTFPHANLDYLDTLAQIPGFGKAMHAVGWAVEDPAAGTVTLPNFTEHNTPDKNGKRAKTHAERQAEYRDRKKQQTLPDPPPSDAPRDGKAVTPPVTGDGKSDGKASYSYSFSTSESESESVSEPQSMGSGKAGKPAPPLPPPPDPDAMPDEVLHYAKQRINRLRGSWSKLPHWSCEEETALFECLPNLRAMEEQDWAILACWLRWAHSKANTDSKDPVRVTSRRHVFVTELAANLDRATAHWKQTGSPSPLNPDGTRAARPSTSRQPPPADSEPLPPPAENAAAFAGLLASHGVRPNVATKPTAA